MHYPYVKGRYARTLAFVKDHYRRNWRMVRIPPQKWWKLRRAWQTGQGFDEFDG